MSEVASAKKSKGIPDKVDVHVGTRLRARRTLLGISQDKLATSIGLTFQQIQKYERGLNRISAGRLYQFSHVLDIPVSYFYENMTASSPIGLSDGTQESFGDSIASAPSDIMNSKETIDLLRTYYSIQDESARKDIQKFIKSMASKIAS